MITDLFPSSVVTVAVTADDPSATLAAAELPAVERAVASRRAEFTTARACAHRALATLGAPAEAVPVGERRAPVWPDGVVGAITHCAGFRAAAVAWHAQVRGLGLDAEPHGPLPEGVLERVSDAQERAVLASLAGAHPDIAWDKILFSAKESVYKTWFPRTRSWLGFEDAALLPAPDGTFAVTLRKPGLEVDGRPVSQLHGRWVVRDGLVVTAVALPPAVT